MNEFFQNWELFVSVSVGFLEVLLRVFPSARDISIINNLMKLLSRSLDVFPNRSQSAYGHGVRRFKVKSVPVNHVS